MTYRVGFLTSHPIQYQVPVFRHLAQQADLEFTAIFCQLPDQQTQGDGFGVSFSWDVPLLDGYRYEVLRNVAKRPSVTEFAGCDTPELADRIHRGAFDALVVNGWVVKSCLQALWACRRLGIPCIVRGEANDIRPRSWWKRLLQRQLVRQYAACLYIGQASERFYLNRGVRPERLFPARYCIDNERFATAAVKVDRVAARQQFGLRPDSTVFLFSGKLIGKKHPLELLSAMQTAIARGMNAELLIVGDGELRSDCEAFVTLHGLPVRFAGFLNQSRIVEAYVASDCLVLPSDHGETWGLVVNEAMACGKPAIVSDQVGCAGDLVIPGETGEVFPFGNWRQLSDVLHEVAANSERLQAYGLAAQQRVAHYSPEAAACGIRQAVEYVCGQQRRR